MSSCGCSVNVVHDEHRDTVTDHIIFNKVGTCTRRCKQNIESTESTTLAYKFFVLQPESRPLSVVHCTATIVVPCENIFFNFKIIFISFYRKKKLFSESFLLQLNLVLRT